MENKPIWLVVGTKDDKPVKARINASSETSARAIAAEAGVTVLRIQTIEANPDRQIVPTPPSSSPSTPPTKPPATIPTSQPAPPSPSTFNRFKRFTAEGQDVTIVARVVERIDGILTSREELQYIAVQQKPVVNVAPDCIALTNRRIIIFRQKVLGRMDFTDLLWVDVKDVQIKETIFGATLTVIAVNETPFAVDHLPKPQARMVYRQAQEAEEAARLNRRELDLEARRASASNVNLTTQVASLPDGASSLPADNSPMAKLQQLKQMLDAGLITAPEYEEHKKRIMSAM